MVFIFPQVFLAVAEPHFQGAVVKQAGVDLLLVLVVEVVVVGGTSVHHGGLLVTPIGGGAAARRPGFCEIQLCGEADEKVPMKTMRRSENIIPFLANNKKDI